METSLKKLKLFITDIDNTVFDWVGYYVPALQSMLQHVSAKINVDYSQLARESSEVFTRYGSVEYPFLVQELPSVMQFYGANLDEMLHDLVEPSRQIFKSVALRGLKPYSGVIETLTQLRKKIPDIAIVALTDAPRYVAMWKLNKLGILNHFDAIYGLADPRIPTDTNLGRVKVDARILLKHLQQDQFGFRGRVRILPEEYEKPGTRGLRTVLMDYEAIKDHVALDQTLWLGDNLRKDVALGRQVGVHTAWAKYGIGFDTKLLPVLHEFSPVLNVQKNLPPLKLDEKTAQPDFIFERFADLLRIV